MDRLMDKFSDSIWRQLERDTERVDLINRSLWDSEWEYQWTSAWNYDDIHMIYHPKYALWCWTDGSKGTTLV